MIAGAIIEAVRKRGSDADDLRDAAHEACHALMWGVKKKWTRDNIHAKKPRERSTGVNHEIVARAVEQLVCADMGVDCGTVEAWAHTCWMEMMKNEGIILPADGWLEKAILLAMKSKTARGWADKVKALAAS